MRDKAKKPLGLIKDKHITEAKLQHRCINHLKKLDYYYVKVIAATHAGVPDLFFLTRKGQAVFMEFKRKTGRVSPLQAANLKKIQANQGLAFVIHSFEEFLEAMLSIEALEQN